MDVKNGQEYAEAVCRQLEGKPMQNLHGLLANAWTAGAVFGLIQPKRRATQQAAPAVQAREFCCKAAWIEAKMLAWKMRDLNCGCDHNESCLRCYPPEFRADGKFHTWESYLALTQAQQEKKE